MMPTSPSKTVSGLWTVRLRAETASESSVFSSVTDVVPVSVVSLVSTTAFLKSRTAPVTLSVLTSVVRSRRRAVDRHTFKRV